MAIEIEIRTLVPSVEQAVSRLEEHGFTLAKSYAQHDVMYDRPDGSLFRGGEKIRVRIENDYAELTYKGNFQREDGISQREEVNIPLGNESVSDTGRILCALGYPMLFQIRKQRTTLALGNVQATIDEWPIIGPMLELEGEEAEIKRIAEAAFPGFEFGNPRLKDLFSAACEDSGKPLEQLKQDYLRETGFDLGNIAVLLG